VPADARILFSNNLRVDEAILTGESLPIEKEDVTLDIGTELVEH
jgi:magnesium-transporting ATPase (P-type)